MFHLQLLTGDFIQETDPEMVILSLFTARPGTEVYNNPKKFGIKHIETDLNKTMHMFGRYEDELPSLTFEYEKQTPWGKSFSNEQIIENYMELQNRLNSHNMARV